MALVQIKQDGSVAPVITLRDRFAMAALAGMDTRWMDAKSQALRAYEVADAMCRCRDSPPKEGAGGMKNDRNTQKP